MDEVPDQYAVDSTVPESSEFSESELDAELLVLRSEESLPYLSHEFTSVLKLLRERQSCSSAYIVCKDAPNPWLGIAGIGSIGIPLSERDAKLIKEYAIEIGHPSNSEDYRASGGVYRIGAQFVHCENPDWKSFLGNRLNQDMRLLMNGPSEGFTFELSNLILHEAGSSATTYEIPGEDNAIGSLLITLPSFFTGGKVHISFNSKAQTYDPSAAIYEGTTAVAWYNVADFSSEPIASGYQVSLLYKIALPPLAVSTMLLPNIMQYVEAELREILLKWNDSPKGSKLSPDLMAIVLQERYSTEDLNTGIACVKGHDAQLVPLLRTLGEEFEYMLCLASYELHLLDPDNNGGLTGFFGYPASDLNPSCITYMVDLEGNKLVHGAKIDINTDASVALCPTKDENPDDFEFQSAPNIWDEPGALVINCYHRTALVIFKVDKKEEILFRAYGLSYALDKLLAFNMVDSPTVDEERVIDVIFDRIRVGDDPERRAIHGLASHALRRKDLDLWNKVIEYSNSVEDIGTAILLEGFRIFAPGSTPSLYEGLIFREESLTKKVQFIQELSNNGSSSDQFMMDNWTKDQISQAIVTYAEGRYADIPVIVTLAREGWAKQLCNLGILSQETKVHFLIGLATNLQGERQAIIASVPNQPEQSTQDRSDDSDGQSYSMHVDALIGRLVECAVETSYTCSAEFPDAHTFQMQHVTELVRLCAFTRRSDACYRVLDFARPSPESLKWIVTSYYMPLASRLHELVPELQTGPCWTPFIKYMQWLIGTYTVKVLGTKTYNPCLPTFSSSCSCRDCAQMYEFLRQLYVPRRMFKMSTKAIMHIKRKFPACPFDMEMVYTNGRAIGVLATKSPIVLKAARWEGRLEQAKQFLAAIGTDEEIALMMGDKYPALLKALEGNELYPFEDELPALKSDVQTSSDSESEHLQGSWYHY
ncbi:hypothetical protein AMATHDRAFT_63197 [Amanita thiersii Skay4041]|uniref:Uncharacterized protein n=1 Tax=Amanita thiersii Skay4041 TaxID=703135 RepID=A0A2A9NM96_9AGAR|nr:hypothetical protein AMATHDRAFT_63197 [Amanita thiersii Skay4041]